MSKDEGKSQCSLLVWVPKNRWLNLPRTPPSSNVAVEGRRSGCARSLWHGLNGHGLTAWRLKAIVAMLLKQSHHFHVKIPEPHTSMDRAEEEIDRGSGTATQGEVYLLG